MPNKENDKNIKQNNEIKETQDTHNANTEDSLKAESPVNNTQKTYEDSMQGMQGNVSPVQTPPKKGAETVIEVSDKPVTTVTRKVKIPSKAPNKSVLRILIICLVILGSLAGIYLYSFLQNEKYLAAIDTDTYYTGIYVDTIHIGGLTKQQAADQILAQQKVKEQDVKVTVTWDEEEFHFYSTDVNISYDTDKILEEAYKIGRDGTNAERYRIVMDLQQNNVRYTTTRNIDPSPIEIMVRDIALSRSRSVSEPAVEFNPDPSIPKEEWFEYSDPIPGIETDDEALWMSVLREFEDETFGSVPVPKWEILPDEDINFRDITQEIVSFKTVQARNSNREHNIALCCSMINGTILMPGEEFSMNSTTGERTKEKGFKEANTIVGGNELVPGIAGGVCQVSGTLFNAALIADLEITERYHHSFELGYLSRGRDATVNYGTADLKFINNKEYPIYIAMYTDGLDVYAEIYGAPLENCDHITIWVKTIKTIPIGDPVYVKDSTVPEGSEPKLLKGHQGITCEVYKIFRDEDGNQIASELAHRDVYKYYAPELHVNPADYEGYINPTPVPAANPTPSPTEDGVG